MWKLVLAIVVLLALIVGSVINYMGCNQGKTTEAYLREGFIKFQEQDYDGAIRNYEKAMALGAKSPNAHNMLGLAYRCKFQQTHDPKMVESEIINFQKAVEIDPNYWAAMLNLGTTYYTQGDKVKAAVWLKKALELNPQHPERALYEKMIAEGVPPPPKKPYGR
jgi:tetratricopeptide (TPR) repeat protein